MHLYISNKSRKYLRPNFVKHCNDMAHQTSNQHSSDEFVKLTKGWRRPEHESVVMKIIEDKNKYKHSSDEDRRPHQRSNNEIAFKN
jgi:hypothetical protein